MDTKTTPSLDDVTKAESGPIQEGEPSRDPLLQMVELATDTGIPDLATNVDHYLYGHPRESEDG